MSVHRHIGADVSPVAAVAEPEIGALQRRVDVECRGIPAVGKFGNLKRGVIRGPAVIQFDLSLRRNLFDNEQKKVSGEFQINIFNLSTERISSIPARPCQICWARAPWKISYSLALGLRERRPGTYSEL